MAGVELPSDPFNPPRNVLDTDEVFPLATVVTQSMDGNLKYTYAKERGGKYTIQVAHSPALDFSFDASTYKQITESDFPAGVIATFFTADGYKIEYVKGNDKVGRKWLFMSRIPNNHNAAGDDTSPNVNGPDRRIEVLYQTPYNGDKEPYHPPVYYRDIRLSDILTDTAVVDNYGGPAYDSSIVGSQKLSLRLQKEAEAKGTPLSGRDGSSVQFDRLVLMSVAFPSKGSIQPEIGVIYG
ncbi:uncharacterized protein TRAVEDRAFT_22522 [Trametes versicolor FP-101664 SS1]|uniref:uncharacterized protein n=1 Tax=Trametes versicolor (strain FP-101664) TaxID=717944 RepID=UPI0004621F73|nr:uncharacterized protein TRAVEDRAFT_22522 [Trametes versicolor FP-101664 SS1]EIW56207.1 hypothetical protein TRAVEDRAFT_22522 [Trametes versicolor FP-101664 SS1]